MSSVLVIDNLKKRIGNTVILSDVTARIEGGHVTAFIGPNGAGKTTLFHCISGELKADSGRLLLNGKSIQGKQPWEIARLGVGKLFQDVRLFENLTVIENLIVALYTPKDMGAWRSVRDTFIRNGYPAELREKAIECLHLVGLPESDYERPAGLLAFGRQKITAFARLLAGGFDVLLLDEPSAGLAPPAVEKLQELVLDLVRRRGITVAVIEHNMAFVSQVARVTYVLRSGTVHDSGPTDDVLNRPENRELCIGL